MAKYEKNICENMMSVYILILPAVHNKVGDSYV